MSRRGCTKDDGGLRWLLPVSDVTRYLLYKTPRLPQRLRIRGNSRVNGVELSETVETPTPFSVRCRNIKKGSLT